MRERAGLHARLLRVARKYGDTIRNSAKGVPEGCPQLVVSGLRALRLIERPALVTGLVQVRIADQLLARLFCPRAVRRTDFVQVRRFRHLRRAARDAADRPGARLLDWCRRCFYVRHARNVHIQRTSRPSPKSRIQNVSEPIRWASSCSSSASWKVPK